MKATGIVRKIDELGRIVLPIELRQRERHPLHPRHAGVRRMCVQHADAVPNGRGE